MKQGIFLFSVLYAVFASALAQTILEPYALTTVAGADYYGTRDGVGVAARFPGHRSLTTDKHGNVYVVDPSGLRKVTPEAVVTTIVRNANLGDVAVNEAGEVYVALRQLLGVFKVGENGTLIPQPQLPKSHCIVFDQENSLYLVTSNAVVKVSPDGLRTTVASTAAIRTPNGESAGAGDIAVDGQGNVYAAGYFSSAIYKSDGNGDFRPFAGSETDISYKDGTGAEARLNQPTALASDLDGNIYFTDGGTHRVRKISPAGVVTTLPGWGEFLNDPYVPVCDLCLFTGPWTLAVDHRGNIFVGALDTTLLKSPPSGPVTVFAGMAGGAGNADGVGEAARFGRYHYIGWSPFTEGLGSVAVDSAGTAYVTDGGNGTVRRITKNREVTTLARPAAAAHAGVMRDLAVDSATNLFVACDSAVVLIEPSGRSVTIAGKPGEAGNADGPGDLARFGKFDVMTGGVVGLTAMTRDSSGNLFVYDSGNNVLRQITPGASNWTVTTLKSFIDTNGVNVRLSGLSTLAGDAHGNLYAVEHYAIRKLTPAGTNWVVTTIAGSLLEGGNKDGPGEVARFGNHDGFRSPGKLTVDSSGNVFVLDTPNQTIRKITPAGFVTTIMEKGSGLTSSRGIATDLQGNFYLTQTFTFLKGFPVPSFQTSPSALSYTNGSFLFNASGPQDQPAIIQVSTNLISWTTVATNTMNLATPVADDTAGASPRRFYRLMYP